MEDLLKVSAATVKAPNQQLKVYRRRFQAQLPLSRTDLEDFYLVLLPSSVYTLREVLKVHAAHLFRNKLHWNGESTHGPLNSSVSFYHTIEAIASEFYYLQENDDNVRYPLLCVDEYCCTLQRHIEACFTGKLNLLLFRLGYESGIVILILHTKFNRTVIELKDLKKNLYVLACKFFFNRYKISVLHGRNFSCMYVHTVDS